MKTSTLFFALLVASTQLFAQATRTFNLKNFDGLKVSSVFKIDLQPGDFSITVSGKQKDLDGIEATVSNGILDMKFKNRKIWNNNDGDNDLRLTVRMPNLKSLDLSGACEATVKGFTNSDNLDLDISGAAKCDINVITKKINLDLSGASHIDLSGSAETMKGDISGASHLDADNFKVKNATVDASGASHASVNVSGNLNADASGASHLSYRGKASVKATKSGAASVSAQ